MRFPALGVEDFNNKKAALFKGKWSVCETSFVPMLPELSLSGTSGRAEVDFRF